MRSKNNGTLVYICVRDAKVHYFIAGRSGKKGDGDGDGEGEGGAKDLYVSSRFPRDAVSPTYLAYPRATFCENDKVLCRLSECGRIRCLNNRSKTTARHGCRRKRGYREARVVALQREAKRAK